MENRKKWERIERGLDLAKKGAVQFKGTAEVWKVYSNGSEKTVRFWKETGEWDCTCQDFIYRQVPCKHINGVKFARDD